VNECGGNRSDRGSSLSGGCGRYRRVCGLESRHRKCRGNVSSSHIVSGFIVPIPSWSDREHRGKGWLIVGLGLSDHRGTVIRQCTLGIFDERLYAIARVICMKINRCDERHWVRSHPAHHSMHLRDRPWTIFRSPASTLHQTRRLRCLIWRSRLQCPFLPPCQNLVS
jgi:hypothetical protein